MKHSFNIFRKHKVIFTLFRDLFTCMWKYKSKSENLCAEFKRLVKNKTKIFVASYYLKIFLKIKIVIKKIDILKNRNLSATIPRNR